MERDASDSDLKKIQSSVRTKNYDKVPLILAGDFNINFQKQKSEILKQFLYNEFGLHMTHHNLQQDIILL